MELLSLLATQSEPAKLDQAVHHLPPPSASDLPDRHTYHPQRTPSITRINTRDFNMDSMSPTSGPRSAFPGSNPGSVSPRQPVAPKNVAFELMFPDQYRARLPMRVKIYPHDTTDSIITTVKNFYGLYATPNSTMGVSFEDDTGTTLIARYENFRDNMNVFVRVTEEPASNPGAFGAHPYHPPPLGPQAFYGNENYKLHQPQQLGHPLTRPDSRTSRQRSASPNPARGRRSASASTAGKNGRSRSSKNRVAGQVYGDGQSDSVNGYSSGDGASASGKAKEQIGNTEISVENIVEGGRRKRAKFDSSELPLFAPPQMPAATSNPSVSPARCIDHHHRPSLPFIPQGQHLYSNPRPLQSPQTYNNCFGHPSMYATPVDRRSRGSIGYPGGILPTPDPTVGSCMSEEDKDVALQLMRLGDMSNTSHGRTSASTLDDTFSGRADAASSTGATSDADSESEDELPAARRQKLNAAGDSRKMFQTAEGHFQFPRNDASVSGDEADSEDAPHGMPKPKVPRPKTKPRSQSITKPKTSKPKASRPTGVTKTKKAVGTIIGPMSPSSLPASRKQSIASIVNPSLQPGEEETPDLSTKPRCQRCRKSKKGCDRQRPCGRCRDAGLSADQCISEDEGNGRKGRYGRHMGVPIKKEDMPNHQPALLPAAPISATPIPLAAAMPAPLPSITMDKSKKRKR